MDLDLEGLPVALIGGAGFIGHHLALELARSGAEVHVVDVPLNRQEEAFASLEDPARTFYAALLRERAALLREAQIRLHALDARDADALWACLEQARPNSIVHLAAIAAAAVTNKDPRGAFDHGLRTLVNALEYARQRGSHFLYISSSMVYGNFKSKAATEQDMCKPIELYGSLKLCGEQIVLGYGRTFNVPYTIVRASALYGERCVARRVGQIYIERALLGRPLTVKGDGSEALDFTYIRDLVKGLILCLTQSAARGHIFNLTFGASRTLNQVIALVKEHFAGVVVNYEERERLTPRRGTLSIAKARRLLGYAPEFSFESGFLEYINWYKQAARRHPEFLEMLPIRQTQTHSAVSRRDS
jgi:nucleoside-diphosphate-sugar epimerase